MGEWFFPAVFEDRLLRAGATISWVSSGTKAILPDRRASHEVSAGEAAPLGYLGWPLVAMDQLASSASVTVNIRRSSSTPHSTTPILHRFLPYTGLSNGTAASRSTSL